MYYNYTIFHFIAFKDSYITATLLPFVPYKVHTKVSLFFTFVPLSEIHHLFCLFPMWNFSVLYGTVLPRSHATLPETRQLPATFLENATQSLLPLSPQTSSTPSFSKINSFSPHLRLILPVSPHISTNNFISVSMYSCKQHVVPFCM